MLSFLSWCTCKITVLFLRMKRFIDISVGAYFLAHSVYKILSLRRLSGCPEGGLSARLVLTVNNTDRNTVASLSRCFVLSVVESSSPTLLIEPIKSAALLAIFRVNLRLGNMPLVLSESALSVSPIASHLLIFRVVLGT